MTWMVIRLILSLGLVGVLLWFAARVAKKRGLGQSTGLIEVVARQRLGRSSTVNVLRIGDVVLVVGATEEQVTLLAEVDGETVEAAINEREAARSRTAPRAVPAAPPAIDADGEAPPRPLVGARPSSGVFAGSVFDRNGWGSFVNGIRERTVRRP
jgi:flagellar protein FliO/FliZ